MAIDFRGPLTSPACFQAGFGIISENRFLDLHEHDPSRRESHDNSTSNANSLLRRIDLHDYSSVTTGDIQQGLQWEIVLSCASPLTAKPSNSNNGSKIGTNLAKLRRKSSVGGAKAVEKLSQNNTPSNDPAATPPAAVTSSTASPSSSKSAAWLKSKLRSKSISASAASLAMSPASSSPSPPQQPLPVNASVLIARNAAVTPDSPSMTDSPQPRPSSVGHVSGNSKTGTKGLSPLVLFTISKDLQLQWIDALSAAIAAGLDSYEASTGSMTTSSSLPSLAVQASPSSSTSRISSELSGFAFPRRPSPSPLRMTTTTNQAILRSQSATTSPTTSFLEIGPSSSSRSSTPCSSKNSVDIEADSPGTVMPSPSASAYKRTSANANPLLPQWLSDVRRNSSGSLKLEDTRTNFNDSKSSSSASSSPSPTPSNHKLPLPVHLERPTMRQSKSSSFLNLDPRRERLGRSPPMDYNNGVFPDRGIKISIHLDEEVERNQQEPRYRYPSSGLSASQPARVRRSSARTYGSHEDRPSTPPIYVSSALSSSAASAHHIFPGTHSDVKLSTPDYRLLSASQTSYHLRPSPSSTSLSSNAASSLCGGGESVSSLAQSADPPTPNPPYIENLGTPQSCELTPTYLPEGNSKNKLQGYFGFPREVVDGHPQEILLHSPSVDKEIKVTRTKEQNRVEKATSPKMPLHARLGAVLSGNNSSSPWSTFTPPTAKSNTEEKDRDSIRSTTSSVSMSNSSSCNNSRQSVTSPTSSHTDSTTTSRKSSYDRPLNHSKPDIGRHIIDPAELRRIMQERLDSSTSSTSSQLKNGRRSAVVSGMKKSASMQAALDSYTRSPVLREDLSASTSTSPDSLEYRKYTFGKAHPAQAPSASYSPVKEGSRSILSPPIQSRMPRSESAYSVDVQALFAALPPPKRRSAGPVRPSTASGGMPTLQETASNSKAT